MSTNCETQICKKRLAASVTAGLVILTIALAELLQIAQVNTPFLSTPTPF